MPANRCRSRICGFRLGPAPQCSSGKRAPARRQWELDAAWIRLKEVMPSGERRTTRRRDRPGWPSDATASAIGGYLCVQSQPGAGQQPDRAPVQPGMHPVPVEFDFVQPLRPFRRLVDEFVKLRFYPTGQRRPRRACLQAIAFALGGTGSGTRCHSHSRLCPTITPRAPHDVTTSRSGLVADRGCGVCHCSIPPPKFDINYGTWRDQVGSLTAFARLSR